MASMFHVSSVLNRSSIDTHGLDWRLMGAAPGIAGNQLPEVEGCFLCVDEFEAEWFSDTINTTGGPVDVWAVQGISLSDLVESPQGHFFYPTRIMKAWNGRVTLIIKSGNRRNRDTATPLMTSSGLLVL